MFALELVTADRNAAERSLQQGSLDVVIVAPSEPYETVRSGERAKFEMLHDTLDPFERATIELIAQAAFDAANRDLVASVLATGQDESSELAPLVGHARSSAAGTVTALEAGNSIQAQAEKASLARQLERIQVLIAPTDSLRMVLGPQLESDQGIGPSTRLANLRSAVDAVDLTNTVRGDYSLAIDELTAIQAELEDIESLVADFQTIEPAVLVSPLAVDPKLVGSVRVDLIAFYAPGVIALLLQHLAITFAALSLVKERLLGTEEIFHIAPVGAGTILIGKYVGYALGALALSAVLSIGMIFAFDVPFTGAVSDFAATLVLLTFASLGVGFLISSLVGSDVQAVNVTMIVLLFSIFFSGFFLTLDRLIPSVRALAYLLPITHALDAMRDIMFRSRGIDTTALYGLGVGSLSLFGLSWWRFARRLRAH